MNTLHTPQQAIDQCQPNLDDLVTLSRKIIDTASKSPGLFESTFADKGITFRTMEGDANEGGGLSFISGVFFESEKNSIQMLLLAKQGEPQQWRLRVAGMTVATKEIPDLAIADLTSAFADRTASLEKTKWEPGQHVPKLIEASIKMGKPEFLVNLTGQLKKCFAGLMEEVQEPEYQNKFNATRTALRGVENLGKEIRQSHLPSPNYSLLNPR